METTAQLEARVQTLVRNVLDGNRIEDDLVECKRGWPDPNKPRQLAGLANAANGSPILLIIGLDEDSSKLTPLNKTEPTEWVNKINSKFDQNTPPRLIQFINVYISETDYVVALLLATDRAPYVVKTESAGFDREVPIRSGTGTRSARRDELLRLLMPTASLPSITILSAELSVSKQFEHSNQTVVEIRGQIGMYVDDVARDGIPTILPSHLTAASVKFRDTEIPLECFYYPDSEREQHSPSRWGIRTDGFQLVCLTAGRAMIRVKGIMGLVQYMNLGADEVEIRIRMGVAGTSKLVSMSSRLSKLPFDEISNDFFLCKWKSTTANRS